MPSRQEVSEPTETRTRMEQRHGKGIQTKKTRC